MNRLVCNGTKKKYAPSQIQITKINFAKKEFAIDANKTGLFHASRHRPPR